MGRHACTGCNALGLIRLAPGCDVSFRVAPAPLSLNEEVYLMGLWRHLAEKEAAFPSPAREWLSRCDPIFFCSMLLG